MNASSTINIILALLGLSAVLLSAHYLAQIRDILREKLELQRRISERLGASSSRK